MINFIKLYKELENAGLPVCGVDMFGKVDYLRELTSEEKTLEQETLLKHDPNPTYQELRQSEYEKAGCTIDALVFALWEMVVENRPESANVLQAKRQEIKNKYPKTSIKI